MYADLLVNEGVMSKEEVGETVAEYSEWLNGILKSMDTYVPQVTNKQTHEGFGTNVSSLYLKVRIINI